MSNEERLQELLGDYETAKNLMDAAEKNARDTRAEYVKKQDALGAFVAEMKYGIKRGDIVSYQKTSGGWRGKDREVTKNFRIRVDAFYFSGSGEYAHVLGVNIKANGEPGERNDVRLGKGWEKFVRTQHLTPPPVDFGG